MRTANDFDAYYQSPDPWGLEKAARRDRILHSLIEPYVAGKSVLELGCGEGHLTETIFSAAKAVRGIDISPVAISRAAARSLPNATFDTADFLSVDFSGYDVIAAIECIYYLSASEQERFYQKLTSEHVGKVFILSGPIIGSTGYRTYFTHSGIVNTFTKHGLSMIEWRNLSAYRKAGITATVAAVASRLPFGDHLVASLPARYVYQRCYAAKV